MIGQFGVGFTLALSWLTKSPSNHAVQAFAANEGVRWESAGTGDFSVENITKEDRGTAIILHLREGEDEFPLSMEIEVCYSHLFRSHLIANPDAKRMG